jgi:hypothetical protein
MKDQNKTQYYFKKDKYVNHRGGNSHFLDLFCSKCNQYFALYQKDGPGRLLRMYLDRIFAPRELSILQSKINNKNDVPNLICPKCGALIGTPMIYEAENRLAFRLVYGSFIKKKSHGVYPPTQGTTIQNEKSTIINNEIKSPSIVNLCKKSNMSEKEVCAILDLLKYSMKSFSKSIGVKENDSTHYYVIERKGIGILKTKYGKFWQYNFAINDQWEKYSVIVKADLDKKLLIPVNSCIFLFLLWLF